VVETLVGKILDTRLGDENGFCLRDVRATNRLIELEFHFRVDSLEAGPLNRFLRDYWGAGAPPAPLDFDRVKGFMTGFIDLIVEQSGRYYVIDYKSNHLGNSASDYGCDALARAMLEHRYDLQYLIYVVALHRYLRYRVPDYDYDSHFGGVFYLFVRGMEGASDSQNGVFRDRPARLALEALDSLLLNRDEETTTLNA
jgi:exodeoxyribonuclease V beta subunit